MSDKYRIFVLFVIAKIINMYCYTNLNVITKKKNWKNCMEEN